MKVLIQKGVAPELPKEEAIAWAERCRMKYLLLNCYGSWLGVKGESIFLLLCRGGWVQVR